MASIILVNPVQFRTNIADRLIRISCPLPCLSNIRLFLSPAVQSFALLAHFRVTLLVHFIL